MRGSFRGTRFSGMVSTEDSETKEALGKQSRFWVGIRGVWGAVASEGENFLSGDGPNWK